MTGCCVCHPSSRIRKSVLFETGIRYENEYSPAEDYALLCKLLPKTNFANIPEALLTYLQRSSTTHLQKDMLISVLRLLLEKKILNYGQWCKHLW